MFSSVQKSAAPLLVAALVACSQAPAQQEDNLIGGDGVARDDYGSTVRLVQSKCTAALVTPTHILTAAHCVFDPATAAPMQQFAAGEVIDIDTGAGTTQAEVVHTAISPTWAAACADTYCGIASVAAEQDANDIAVIVLSEPLVGVTPTPIDVTPVAEGDTVTLEGFGCEEGLYEADARDEATLARADARVLAAEEALHEGSYIEEQHLENASGTYFMTAGPNHDTGGPGLCPGDSGGPVYAERDGRLVVVGINANYTLFPESGDDLGLPVTNWHTRLDDVSRHETAAWLAEFGALGASAE